jgi:hypothetical protein
VLGSKQKTLGLKISEKERVGKIYAVSVLKSIT